MFIKIPLRTEPGESLVDVTEEVNRAVSESGVKEGACVVYVPHTTAGVTLNSALDVKTSMDILDDLNRLVPTRVDFHHQYDTPQDAAGHIKAVLVGSSVMVIIEEGKLALGGSQSLLFSEFDGPRDRQLWLKMVVGTA